MYKQDIINIINTVKSGHTFDLVRSYNGKEYDRRFLPKARLIILGGGHVAKYICQIAAIAGFSVVVVDDREEYANATRFPDAEQTIAKSFTEAIAEIDILPSDFICIVTREHVCDMECLHALMKEVQPQYIGMMGSKRRAAGSKKKLLDEGYDPARVKAIHAPIGLSIGAVTPAEISISILAEILQVRTENSKKASYLKQTNTDYNVLNYLAEEGPRAILYVLASEGSTPSKPGSVMACDESGNIRGTIGGGRGEYAAIQKAISLLGTGESVVMDIDMTAAMDTETEMECGGRMLVWIEDVR